MTECRICLGCHSPETHEATRRIHEWFRDKITLGMEPVTKGAPKTAPNALTGMLLTKSDVGPAWEDRR